MTIKRKSLLRTGVAMAIALSATALSADELRFWTTEEQPERLARQEAMAADFAAATGHTVEVIPVTENDLGTRATAAFAAGDLPDVIYHPLQYAAPWAEAGILDTDAATDVVENLGGDTFALLKAAMPLFRWMAGRRCSFTVLICLLKRGLSRQTAMPTCWLRLRRCTTRQRCTGL